VTDGRLQETITALTRINTGRTDSEGLRVFAGLHRQAQDLVVARIRSGFFADPVFVERLAVHTAAPFLDAARQAAADEKVAPAWRPLATGRRQAGLQPVQFALAGINAVLNHDAPVALVRGCEDAGVSPYRPDVEQDFHRFCALLVEFAEPVRAAFLNDHQVGDGRSQSAMVALVTKFSISKAKSAAWANGLTLWQIASIEALAQPFEWTLAHTTGLIGGQLLVGFVDHLEVTQPLTEEMLFGR
jgi:hypothetical protein